MTKTVATLMNSNRRRDDLRASTTIGAASVPNPEQARANPWEGLSPELPMLRERDIREQLGLSTSTLYEMVSAGTFPPPIKIAPRVVAWPSNHLAAWLADRAEKSQARRRRCEI